MSAHITCQVMIVSRGSAKWYCHMMVMVFNLVSIFKILIQFSFSIF